MTTLTITRITHSSVLIDFDGHQVLTDPWFSEKVGYYHGEPYGIVLQDLPRLDGVVVSHEHLRPLRYASLTGRVKIWSKYLDMAYPGRKPADWDTWLVALQANLREPGRIKAAQKMVSSKKVDAAAQLTNVRCPVLVVMGRNDSDFPDPEAEAAAIVGLLPAGLGRYEMIEDAGHYPHAQYPRAFQF